MRKYFYAGTAAFILAIGVALASPESASACGRSISFRAIDENLKTSKLAPEELAKARELRTRAEALIMAGQRTEGQNLHDELMHMLGMPLFRC